VPDCSCYIPFFIHGKRMPKIVSTAGTHGSRVEMPSKTERDKFSAESYWWLFRDLTDRVAKDRGERLPLVRKTFDGLEKQFEAGVPAVVEKAVRLRKEGRRKEAAGVLDDYTAECLSKVLKTVNDLRARFADAGRN